MHFEAETVLYGMNQFKVSRRLPGDNLKALRILLPRVWPMLSSLHISLSEVPPFRLGISERGYPTCEAIDIKDAAGQETLRGWEVLCRDVLSHAFPHHLKLSLSCNAENVATARAVVTPLEKLPPMAGLSICLAVDPKRRAIKEIAMDAVSRLGRKEWQGVSNLSTSRSSSLSWTSLPRELRLDILSRTDLVDDFFLIMPSSSHYGHYKGFRRCGFEIYPSRLLHRGRPCCYDCTPTLSTCACALGHAASSTSCTCPIVPASVFSVSKEMSAEATLVFFSCNHFILSGEFDASMTFLQCESAHNVTSLGYVRMLDLEISYRQLCGMQDPNSYNAKAWAALIACVASLLPLPRLWLSIDAGSFREDLEDPGRGEQDYTWISRAYITLFDTLNVHLCDGRKPRKFHVFFCWDTEKEEKFEKAIMGEGYNSVAEGKIMWQNRHPRFPHSEKVGE